ncbi:TRAP transporter large permease [Thermodesulfobacteriota bacterium]
MDPATVGYIGLAILFILLFSGMPIGLVMAVIGVVGMVIVTRWEGGIAILGNSPYLTWSSYDLSVTPLFILMGSICFHAGISQDLYRSFHNWLGHMPGGLAMATVGACAGFSAVSGSSLATVATMGMVSLPEMERYKYSPALACGSVAAGGSMGILIPPSIVLIIYGMLTEQSIGKLFLAGFIPGVLEAVSYMIVIYVMCRFNPLMGPRGPLTTLRAKFASLKDTWVVLALFMLVIGGIYLGIFTPTEAGGIGAFGALLFALLTNKLTWKTFGASLLETTKTSAMIFVLLLGAVILNYFMAVTRLPFELTEFISGLPVNRYVIIMFIIITYILLGCVISSMALILLTVPIFFPVIVGLGFDPIWFGIIAVRVMEVGQITPPVGINVFIVKGIAKDIPMGTIFRGIIPFFMADILGIALLVAVPQLATFLPSLIR